AWRSRVHRYGGGKFRAMCGPFSLLRIELLRIRISTRARARASAARCGRHPGDARMSTGRNLLHVGGVVADMNQAIVAKEWIALGDDHHIVSILEERKMLSRRGAERSSKKLAGHLHGRRRRREVRPGRNSCICCGDLRGRQLRWRRSGVE